MDYNLAKVVDASYDNIATLGFVENTFTTAHLRASGMRVIFHEVIIFPILAFVISSYLQRETPNANAAQLHSLFRTDNFKKAS